jgi:hypothetical protein
MQRLEQLKKENEDLMQRLSLTSQAFQKTSMLESEKEVLEREIREARLSIDTLKVNVRTLSE